MTGPSLAGRLKPRERVDYKKPSKINSVSVGLTLFMGVLCYLMYCAWPGFMQLGKVKDILQTQIMTLYQLNLGGYGDAQRRYFQLQKSLEKDLRAAGITDPDLKIVLHRDKKTVSISAEYTSMLELDGLNKRIAWHHSPSVETLAARVDW